jgi:hypothetical protein
MCNCNNTCSKCLETTKCPLIEECDIISTDCVEYKDSNITCGEETVVVTNDNVTTIIKDLYERICDLNIDPGKTIISAVIEECELIITYSDSTSVNLGNVCGADGTSDNNEMLNIYEGKQTVLNAPTNFNYTDPYGGPSTLTGYVLMYSVNILDSDKKITEIEYEDEEKNTKDEASGVYMDRDFIVEIIDGTTGFSYLHRDDTDKYQGLNEYFVNYATAHVRIIINRNNSNTFINLVHKLETGIYDAPPPGVGSIQSTEEAGLLGGIRQRMTTDSFGQTSSNLTLNPDINLSINFYRKGHTTDFFTTDYILKKYKQITYS